MPLTYPAFFDVRWCHECLTHHWVETHPARPAWQQCHGENFAPTASSPEHYARRNGRGYELRAKGYAPAEVDTAWRLAIVCREDSER